MVEQAAGARMPSPPLPINNPPYPAQNIWRKTTNATTIVTNHTGILTKDKDEQHTMKSIVAGYPTYRPTLLVRPITVDDA